jgi:hypothetical protein
VNTEAAGRCRFGDRLPFQQEKHLEAALHLTLLLEMT